jgi:hypothetical protein
LHGDVLPPFSSHDVVHLSDFFISFLTFRNLSLQHRNLSCCKVLFRLGRRTSLKQVFRVLGASLRGHNRPVVVVIHIPSFVLLLLARIKFLQRIISIFDNMFRLPVKLLNRLLGRSVDSEPSVLEVGLVVELDARALALLGEGLLRPGTRKSSDLSFAHI